jgi:hypothetical protein
MKSLLTAEKTAKLCEDVKDIKDKIDKILPSDD